jgi:hypothetical protein
MWLKTLIKNVNQFGCLAKSPFFSVGDSLQTNNLAMYLLFDDWHPPLPI